MEHLNIESYVGPTEAPWQAGLGDRRGGILKTMHCSVVHEVSARELEETEVIRLDACLAKNQLTQRHGVCTDSARAGAGHSLADIAQALTSLSAAAQEGPFQRRLASRQAARMAWARLDNSSRIRRAMMSRTRA